MRQRSVVREKQADFHYEQGQFVLAASYYAETAVPLEQVAMKFLAKETKLSDILASAPRPDQQQPSIVGDGSDQTAAATEADPWATHDALQIYLTKTLEKIAARGSPDAKTQQRTLLATWILELFLKKLKFCKTAPTQRIRDDLYSWMGENVVQVLIYPPL